MKDLYKKYNGMLMTFPEGITEEEILSYKNSGKKPVLREYDKETFNRLAEQAKNYSFGEIIYIDGEKRKDKEVTCGFTPENIVVLKNKLFAVRYLKRCAVGSDVYVIPLSDMEKGPCLASTSVDRFDDYGDHDSWTVDVYIEMTVEA